MSDKIELHSKVVAAWNLHADEYNQWPSLGEDEKVEYAYQLGYKAAIGDADDAWADALQSDLENGVRSLNEAASNELHEKYPEMAKLGEAIRQLGGG